MNNTLIEIKPNDNMQDAIMQGVIILLQLLFGVTMYFIKKSLKNNDNKINGISDKVEELSNKISDQSTIAKMDTNTPYPTPRNNEPIITDRSNTSNNNIIFLDDLVKNGYYKNDKFEIILKKE